MGNTVLQRVAPWGDDMKAGHYGVPGAADPVVVTKPGGLSSVSVIARKGTSVTVVMGLEMPETGRWVANDKIRIASDGPDQWRIVGTDFDEGRLYTEIRNAVGSTAGVIDQSHGWATLQISGEMTPDVLAKGTSLDMHLDSFGVGQCAVTQIGHMSVHLTCLEDEGPAYVCQFFRSMAGSFAHWVKDSSAVYGVRIE